MSKSVDGMKKSPLTPLYKEGNQPLSCNFPLCKRGIEGDFNGLKGVLM